MSSQISWSSFDSWQICSRAHSRQNGFGSLQVWQKLVALARTSPKWQGSQNRCPHLCVGLQSCVPSLNVSSLTIFWFVFGWTKGLLGSSWSLQKASTSAPLFLQIQEPRGNHCLRLVFSQMIIHRQFHLTFYCEWEKKIKISNVIDYSTQINARYGIG